jgi:3-methylcrotonyl-CoA carboxylase beta subunit
MSLIHSRLSTADEEFRLNRAHYEGLIATLHEKRRIASLGGPPKARERHLARG